MKKISIVLLMLVAFATGINAQDLKKVKNLYTLGRVEEAKAELDKMAGDAKAQASADFWLLKFQVLGLLTTEEALVAKFPNAGSEALGALKKYMELDPSHAKLKEDRFAGLNEVYMSFFNQGVKNYNTDNWDAAFEKFQMMSELGDMLIQNKWTSSSFDTTAYLYAGVTAQNAKKEDEANKYFSALCDNKMKGADYEGVYEYVTKYHLRNSNEEKFRKYNALAKEFYPENSLWDDLEFEFMARNYQPAQVLKKFNEEDAAKSINATTYADYGNYFANDKKVRDLDDKERKEFSKRAYYAFSRSHQLDTSNAITAYNAGVTSFTNFEELLDSARAIKGVTPEIKAKRAQADKLVDAAAATTIEWLEKAFGSFVSKDKRTNMENGLLNKTIDILYNMYSYKRDRARGVNPKDYDAADAKMKYYDGLHGKY